MNEDFIVGYTLFKPTGFRTRYQHFDKLEVAKMFASNVNLKDTSKIYVPLELYEKQQKEIKELREDISNMYDKQVVRNILEDECGLSKYEIDELLEEQ